MAERMEILTSTRVISGENTAEMAVLLATSAAPTPPESRHTPIPSMDAPGCLVGASGGWQRADTTVLNAMV